MFHEKSCHLLSTDKNKVQTRCWKGTKYSHSQLKLASYGIYVFHSINKEAQCIPMHTLYAMGQCRIIHMKFQWKCRTKLFSNLKFMGSRHQATRLQYSSLCFVLIIQQIKYYSDKTIDFIRIRWTTQNIHSYSTFDWHRQMRIRN